MQSHLSTFLLHQMRDGLSGGQGSYQWGFTLRMKVLGSTYAQISIKYMQKPERYQIDA